jgi:hypothetical protein
MKRWVMLAALTLASCSSSSGPTGTPDGGAASWHVVLQGLKSSLLCVWGTSPTAVWAVGGSLGNGNPATILYYDGAAWGDLGPGGTETFWWVHGTYDKDVWAVGTNGHIVHWDGSTFTDHSVMTTATLYGVWAAAPNDVWVVGGTPEGGTKMPNDVLLHWDGTSFTPSPLPMMLGRTFFKVWGTSSSNLYVVGEFGTIWHRVGTTWTLEKSPATGNLTTVFGCSATQVYAVGFSDVLSSDGKTWTKLGITVENGGVNGVSCEGTNVVIVGFGGFKQRLVSGQWVDDTTQPPSSDFHGAWADSRGGFWAAGGDFVSVPTPGASRVGTLAYYGVNVPTSTVGK